jgi:hypothetical protein
MAHIRTQVRTAVLAAITGLATTGARAYVAHDRPLIASELPCVLLTVSDTAEAESITSALLLRRTVAIEVQAVAKATTGLADTLDQIAEEVEQALGVALTVDGQQLFLRYTGTAAADINSETDRPVGAIGINFEVDFYTQATNAGAIF